MRSCKTGLMLPHLFLFMPRYQSGLIDKHFSDVNPTKTAINYSFHDSLCWIFCLKRHSYSQKHVHEPKQKRLDEVTAIRDGCLALHVTNWWVTRTGSSDGGGESKMIDSDGKKEKKEENNKSNTFGFSHFTATFFSVSCSLVFCLHHFQHTTMLGSFSRRSSSSW